MEWWIALDVGPRATELVLGTFDRRWRLPLCAEGTGWRGCTTPERVMGRVEGWEARYQIKVDAFIVTSRTPRSCSRELRRRGYLVETVFYEELEDIQESWRSLGLRARWRRGEWLCGLAMSRLHANASLAAWTGWDWIYAGLNRHVQSLADRLRLEGLGNPALSGLPTDWLDLPDEDGCPF